MRSPASPFKPHFPEPSEPVLHWNNLFGSAEGLAIAQAAATSASLTIVVARNPRRLGLLDSEIRFYLSNEDSPDIVRLPNWECLPYDLFSPHPDITSERLSALAKLPKMQQGILLITLETLMQRLPPNEYVLGQSFALGCGEKLEIEQFRHQLQASGYLAVSQVMVPGEYAVRGGVIDVFSTGLDNPFRLDLFGNEIESIRFFDPETQRSIKKAERIDLLPAREFPMTENSIRRFRENFRAKFEGDPQQHLIYREVSRGNTPAGVDFFFPLFFAKTATLFEYLPPNPVWVLDGETDIQAKSIWAQILDRYQTASTEFERRPLTPDDLYQNPSALAKKLTHQRCALVGNEITNAVDIDFGSRLPDQFPVQLKSDAPYSAFISHLKNCQSKTLLVAETRGRCQGIEDLLTHDDIRVVHVPDWSNWIHLNQPPALSITIGQLDRGMVLPAANIEVVTESQMYSDRVQQRRRRSQRGPDPETIVRSLAELAIGDPVVHEEQGVGRYRGLQKLGIEGEQAEFLILEYQGGDRLYVPVLSLHLVGRYIGGDAESAPLHKLGSGTWEKAKKRAQEKVHDIAAELLEMEATRTSRDGFSFHVPQDDYNAFVADFPFEETPDQERVMSEVLEDLSLPRPMDRLICGDVGFGKTEIALRAAFTAVYNQKQVALLVPTTLLAQQHFETFRDRFADFPIQVELLSSFRNQKDIETILESLPKGYPDIVIGTHRLLQRDIRFRDLGLLIIDEEHRFGVRQKETLKRLRQEVDILALTATPIPRTLNISLAGLRSISLIATPPPERRSIKTFVRPRSDNLVQEACIREIHRGGQVFFLHNEVHSIETAADRLAKLVPEGEIRVAHGQMPKRQLEHVMRDFYHQRFNILVCTTIIESGIDIPSANTIVVNHADRLGLAQLHQLRGRVGRSHHQAYAYLLTPPSEYLRADSEKRLEAISQLDELGAGFLLASHDLEIRGAGDLLGEEQSGTIDEIGFSLYSEYLGRAIRDLAEPNIAARYPVTRIFPIHTEVQLNLPALFPDSYLPDVHIRLVLYKRITGATSTEELRELQLETIDRFGLLPEAAKSLFRISKLQLVSESLGVRRFTLDRNGGKIEFGQIPTVKPTTVLQMMNSQPNIFRMTDSHVIQIRAPLEEHQVRLRFAENTLAQLSPK